ncbi:hypothetical protein OQA88_8714 [Cercophora sp. LCS_1]
MMRSSHDPASSRDGLRAAKSLCLADFIEPLDKPALLFPDPTKTPITHRDLSEFVNSFSLSVPSYVGSSQQYQKPVVCIALPNGPTLAAVVLAVANRFIAAPVNAAVGAEQFQADVKQSGATCIVTTKEEAERLELLRFPVLDENERAIPLFFVQHSGGRDGEPCMRVVPSSGNWEVSPPALAPPNAPGEIGIILFTSGTSGTKKVVPITVHNIVSGVEFVVRSWGLEEDDVCLNMMPLFHIGGLVRNIFAPIFSRGSTVCCPAFDPSLFWDVVEELGASWYYASPSMHQMILDQADCHEEALEKSRIRLVCNAAGGLLPALAERIRDTFDCIVLPSYGMTECMPISTPPTNYRLDRPGTSGIAVGPELTILNWEGTTVAPGTIGRICVRGDPVFPGYLTEDGKFDRSPFDENGWFDTGDLGYMCADGYLYITGRSKEVINRGGEIISPFEIENAIVSAAEDPESPIFGRVNQALAFSAPHDVLQEVAGIVLVTPPGAQRVDLRQLHLALKASLQQAKWPMVIVYMDDVPKRNNKVLRVRLGERLAIPELTDDTPYRELHWEGACPKPDTELSVDIIARVCRVSERDSSKAVQSLLPSWVGSAVRKDEVKGTLEAFVFPTPSGRRSRLWDDGVQPLIQTLKRELPSRLHGYLIPHKFSALEDVVPLDSAGRPQSESLDAAIHRMREKTAKRSSRGGSTASRVAEIFAAVLSCETVDIELDADFFAMGGDSLRAGKLVSLLRAHFGVLVPIHTIFQGGTANKLAVVIDQKLRAMPQQSGQADTDQTPQVDTSRYQQATAEQKTYSSTNPFLLIFQLIPILLLYPIRWGAKWAVFLFSLALCKAFLTSPSIATRLFVVVGCLLFSRLVILICVPFVSIICKWLIIGRHKPGLYPMWGVYHSRWWIVQKISAVFGMGILSFTNPTRILYYRLMGAKIGKGVKIESAQIGEWDLVEIQDGAKLDHCICRPFGAETNTQMYLGRIVIGKNASVGLASIVAPGTRVPDGTCIGPNSSSWELHDATEANRDLSFHAIPEPHWLLDILGTLPIFFLTRAFGSTPWLLGILGLVSSRPSTSNSPLLTIAHWFANPHRVGYHFLGLCLQTIFGPFFLFAIVYLVKVIIDRACGELGPSRAEGRGHLERWRTSLMRILYPGHALQDLTGLFGKHYEATSIVMRLLGAKVGKRIYWPGTGPGIGDYHLVDVGNDVVFGSRGHFVTSDGTSSEVIKVKDGAMVADRVVLLPGVTIGEQTVMGSGALTKRGKTYTDNAVYVGSQGGDSVCLSGGSSSDESDSDTLRSPSEAALGSHCEKSCKSEADLFRPGSSSSSMTAVTVSSGPEKPNPNHEEPPAAPNPTPQPTPDGLSSTPFGRAFYLRQAPYRVLSQIDIFGYSMFIRLFSAVYWHMSFVLSVQIFDRYYRPYLATHMPINFAGIVDINPFTIFGLFTSAFSIIILAQALGALLIVIAAKWAIIGRRTPGNYSWDVSSYCQRWQLFLAIEGLRRDCFHGEGVLSLLTGTWWSVLYFRALGAKIGKDCALFANGRPSLVFTEPDLLTLGDRVTVDDASLVGHINTRGKFDLNRLEVGDRSVLRTGSRLLSGAKMESDTVLLEHTLVMGGETVEKGTTMQGWPAEVFTGPRIAL